MFKIRSSCGWRWQRCDWRDHFPSAPAHAQKGRRRRISQGAGSLMDYIEIQQLVARYGYALIPRREGTGRYAGLWTKDAQFVGPGIADGTIDARNSGRWP